MCKMGLLYLILIFIHLGGYTNAVSCVSYNKGIENLTLAAAKEFINKQPLGGGYEKCAIGIRYDYNQKYMEIEYGYNVESDNLKINRQVGVETSIFIADDSRMAYNPPRIKTSVEFACDYADECDRHFVLDHLDWLFKADYNQLTSVVYPLLLTNNNKTGLCINYTTNREQSCGSQYCNLYYFSSNNNMTGACTFRYGSKTRLDITYFITIDKNMYEKEDEDNQSEVKIAEQNFTMQYYCGINNCNNRTTAELMKKAVNEHYDLSGIYKALKMKINETSTSATEDSTTIISDTTASTIVTTTTEQLKNNSISFDISIIMIIFNVLLFRFF